MSSTAPIAPRRPAGRNVNLQWLRAIAALFVVLFHASYYLKEKNGDASFQAVFDGKFGLVGVAIFFAISGALMTDILKRVTPATFLAHRLVRIYPLFLIVFLFVALVIGGDWNADVRAMSLGLVGTRVMFELGVEWTLLLEIFFYVLLFLVAACGFASRIEQLAVAWLAIVVAATFVGPPELATTLSPILPEALFLPANAAFAGGLLIPWMVSRRFFQPALAVVALGCAMASMSFDLGIGRLLGAVAAVILVGFAFAYDTGAPATSLPGRLATRMGDWSYALYLCHVATFDLVLSHVTAPAPVLWVTAVAAAILVSIPLGMMDVSLYKRLRRRVDAASPLRLRFWTWLYVGIYLALAILFIFKQ